MAGFPDKAEFRIVANGRGFDTKPALVILIASVKVIFAVNLGFLLREGSSIDDDFKIGFVQTVDIRIASIIVIRVPAYIFPLREIVLAVAVPQGDTTRLKGQLARICRDFTLCSQVFIESRLSRVVPTPCRESRTAIWPIRPYRSASLVEISPTPGMTILLIDPPP
jgi:hypothetical protein